VIDARRATFAGLILAITLILAGCGGGGGPAAAPSVPQNPAGAEVNRAAAATAQVSTATAAENDTAVANNATATSIFTNAIDGSPPKVGGTYNGTLHETTGPYAGPHEFYIYFKELGNSKISGEFYVGGAPGADDYPFTGWINNENGQMGFPVPNFFDSTQVTASVSAVTKSIRGSGQGNDPGFGTIKFWFTAKIPPDTNPSASPCLQAVSTPVAPGLTRC
jgi:hypothetical protein